MRIAFIDPFIKDPAVHCFNELVQTFNLSSSYYMPSLYGTSTLSLEKDKHEGYIVAGSASHVTDPLPWHDPLAQFLLEELKRGKPVLGCCFGHQLMNYALGGAVDFHSPDRQKLMGSRSITITRDFWNFRKGDVFELPVTHRQVVKTLGKGLISVGEGLPFDILIHENLPLLTTQAHPEASGHFCITDIEGLGAEALLTARNDGKRFIGLFLEYLTHRRS